MHPVPRSSSRSLFPLLAIAAFALALLGCEQIQELMKQAEEAGVTEPAGPPPPTPLQIENTELNNYVECYNRAVTRGNESIARYYSYVPKDVGPDCDKHKGDLYTLYEDSVQICNDAAKTGSSSGPKWTELEASVTELAAANAVLVPLAQKVNDYWEQEDFKDDACAGGKALHTEFVAAADRFQAAEITFSKELDIIKSTADRNALKRTEKEFGKNYEWHTRNMTIEAKELLDLVPSGPDVPFDNEAFFAQNQSVEDAYNALQDYADNNKAEIEKNVFIGAGVETYAKDFYAAGKFVRRELEAEKLDNGALGEKINTLIDEYNDLISATNRLQFRYEH